MLARVSAKNRNPGDVVENIAGSIIDTLNIEK